MSAFERNEEEELPPPPPPYEELNKSSVKKTVTFSIPTPFDEIKREDIFGPLDESNWVIPNKLIAGAFPGFVFDAENTDSLIKILNCGVNRFVCMQEEYNPLTPESEWRSVLYRKNPIIRPYFKDVQNIIQNKADYPTLKTDVVEVTFDHCPIKDCSIVADEIVFDLAKKLVDAIRNGDVIYLHCWGGHGRTGVMVCLILHLMYGLTADESLKRCQLLHDARKRYIAVSSPQTFAQQEQVRRIINTKTDSENYEDALFYD
jgi:protein-tyrosine phosphatase